MGRGKGQGEGQRGPEEDRDFGMTHACTHALFTHARVPPKIFSEHLPCKALRVTSPDTVLVQTEPIAAPHGWLPLSTHLLISCSYQVSGRAHSSPFADEKTKAQRGWSVAQGHTAAADPGRTPRCLKPSLCAQCCPHEPEGSAGPRHRRRERAGAGWAEGVGLAAPGPREGGTQGGPRAGPRPKWRRVCGRVCSRRSLTSRC